MDTRQLLLVGMSVVASAVCGAAAAQEMQGQYVQIAEIEIDPLQLEDYKGLGTHPRLQFCYAKILNQQPVTERNT